MIMPRQTLFAILVLCTLVQPAMTIDWPQLQKDAARTGRTTDSVAPSYRARWIWVGPGLTLRNRDSVSGWPDDLTSRAGYSYPMPSAVNFTIAESVQPVLVNNRLFVGTQEGQAYAINADDGSTLWSTTIAGGTVATAAVSTDGTVVVFVCLNGRVYGLNTTSGGVAWSYAAKKSITGAPLISGSQVYFADHGGYVYALNATTGGLAWSTRLEAPILGGIAADATSLYVGVENMMVYALNLNGGTIRAQHPVRGQSFRMLWPMVFNNKVWVHSIPTPVIGSEYVMETLMAGSGSLSQEENNIALWLQGNSQWADSGRDWQHIFALQTSDLSEPVTILAGPADGCGVPPAPAVVDNSDRVLAYFKTRYPRLTATTAFGTNYSIDIAGVDPNTGRRIPIDNGRLTNLWPWESDNLFAMTVGGSYLWLRQNFRGTQVINLATSTAYPVQAQVRNWDGGDFSSRPIIYRDQAPPIAANQNEWMGRVAPIIVGSRAYFTESYALTAVEHRP